MALLPTRVAAQSTPAATVGAPSFQQRIDALIVPGRPLFPSWVSGSGDNNSRIQFRELLPAAPAADRWRIYQTLGAIDEELFEWSTAITDYRAAIAAANNPSERAAAQLGLARAQRIAAPADTEATLAGLEGLAAAAPAVAHLRARLMLTTGDPRAALARFGAALAAAGNHLDETTAPLVQAILADMSVASALANDFDAAADYAAASGIGNDDVGGGLPERGLAPRCNPASGLTPADAAIFDVAIYRGRPARVVPIWSRRPGATQALAGFGKSIAAMEWRRDSNVNVLARGVRIFIACSASGAEPDGGIQVSQRSMASWLSTKGVAFPTYSDAPPEVRLRDDAAALAAVESRNGLEAVDLVPLLVALGTNPGVPAPVAHGHLERAVAILARNGAPTWITVPLQFRIITSFAEDEATRDAEIVSHVPDLIAKLPPGEETAGFALVIRSWFVIALARTGDTAGAEAGLRALLAVPKTALPQNDPLRIKIAERLANLLDKRGRRAEADAMRISVGLTTTLCEYADDNISSIGVTIDEEAYPRRLRRASIGGLVKVERDVETDGSTGRTRIIYAQPPLLFDAVSLAPFTDSRNTVPTRGGKPFPCTANPKIVRWRLNDYGSYGNR